MVEKTKKTRKDSTKRFGPRYGRSLKDRVSEAEAGHRGRHKCPYCSKKNIKRLAAGIWFCTSCKTKFAGGAYHLVKPKTEETEEEFSSQSSSQVQEEQKEVAEDE